MDKDSRKEYNKVYYELNRERILNLMCEKTTCQLCKKMVIKANLNRHQDTAICVRTQERNIKLEQRLNKYLTN